MWKLQWPKKRSSVATTISKIRIWISRHSLHRPLVDLKTKLRFPNMSKRKKARSPAHIYQRVLPVRDAIQAGGISDDHNVNSYNKLIHRVEVLELVNTHFTAVMNLERYCSTRQPQEYIVHISGKISERAKHIDV